MKTEDDTFNTLRRISYEEMNDIPKNVSGLMAAPLFKQHGWDVVEFWKEFERRSRQQSNAYDTYQLEIRYDSVVWKST